MDLFYYSLFFPVALPGGAAQFNGQLRIDNGQFSFSPSFINGTGSATVEAQRAAPHDFISQQNGNQ